jgi:hypothetical protein
MHFWILKKKNYLFFMKLNITNRARGDVEKREVSKGVALGSSRSSC